MSLTFVVTGANRGLGLEFARQLSERGDRVIATVRDLKKARELRALNVRVEPLDVAEAGSVAEFASRLAGSPVDVLIHNAGIGWAGPGLEGLEAAELLRNFCVNSIGPLLLTQALLPNLRAGRRKTVAALSSGLASLAQNLTGGWYAYRAAKAALNMFIRTLAVELAGEGFLCVLLNPGWVRTDMGGADAPVEPAASVRGMLEVLDSLAISDTGGFYHYTGKTTPW